MYIKKSTWLIFVFACIIRVSCEDKNDKVSLENVSKESTDKELLHVSETGEPKKVDIVKEIRRLNDDGSYTVGYEAGDGTFKIESRDVLGNVKGTYGYIDDNGQIKRVSYSSTNSTLSTVSSSQPMPATTRHNKTSSSTTTRRPLPTVVYPRGSSSRPTVIQPIPRKRNKSGKEDGDVSTESTSDNLSRTDNSKIDDTVTKPTRLQTTRSLLINSDKEYLQAKQTTTEGTTKAYTPKPVYEYVTEKDSIKPPSKSNTFRRQLGNLVENNPHMINLQQSIGDDSTDVYAGSLGTVRPLFTTTTPRPRLIPFQQIIAARDRLKEHIKNIPVTEEEEEQETTIEASTGRVIDSDHAVTLNPQQAVHIPTQRDRGDERLFPQTIYRQYPQIQFRTREYLRDNPGAPVPIGNQRPYFAYEYQNSNRKDDGNQFLKETVPRTVLMSKHSSPEAAAAPSPYAVRPVSKVIPVAVDDRGVPIVGYNPNYVSNAYHTQIPQSIPLRNNYIQQPLEPSEAIQTPVSTKDLKKLLNMLLIRQQQLQALIDAREGVVHPGPPYQSQPVVYYRNQPVQEDYRTQKQYVQQPTNYQPYVPQRSFQLLQPAPAPPASHFRTQPLYNDPVYINRQNYEHQQELYSNQINNYEENNAAYDSQRYIPRRRLYRPNYETNTQYETESSNTNHIQEHPEFLPPDIREALLLKMLMLAINPEYLPPMQPAIDQPTEMTTAAPPRESRKKVRNVQILGEVGSNDMKDILERH